VFKIVLEYRAARKPATAAHGRSCPLSDHGRVKWSVNPPPRLAAGLIACPVQARGRLSLRPQARRARRSKVVAAKAAETSAMFASLAEVRSAELTTLGDLPLVVVSRGILGGSVPGMSAADEKVWQRRRRILQRDRRGANRVRRHRAVTMFTWISRSW
jgi:hypothetical protein